MNLYEQWLKDGPVYCPACSSNEEMHRAIARYGWECPNCSYFWPEVIRLKGLMPEWA